MLERDMEGLIAAYPEEFFPGHGFALVGRQQTFAGIGRFDLLFKDRFGTNVLMELKAVPAKYENATQLAKYKEALEQEGYRDILMWLVAPSIPSSVREFLDRIGIEYSELHQVQFRRIAARHGIDIPERAAGQARSTPTARTQSPVPVPSSQDENEGPDVYELREDFDRASLNALLIRFESVAKRGIDKSLAANLRREMIDVKVPTPTVKTVKQLARWCKTDGIYSEGMRVAQDISRLLFGVVVDRQKLRT